MGLDMYAYAVKAELVGNEQVDVDVRGAALSPCGHTCYTDEAFDALSQSEKQAYWNQRDVAIEQAHEQGLLDTNFAYWRKFNNLHGWMERLYREKGGASADFNCDTVRLEPEDLDRLERDAKAGDNLEPQAGFFFGSMEMLTVEDQEEILEFVARARTAQAEGMAIFYSSWW